MKKLFFILTLVISTISIAQTNWTRNLSNPVLTADSTTIEHMADPSVIFDNGLYKMWCGCVESNPSHASICYSESSDGSNWTAPVIVFSPNLVSGAWDNMKTEIPTVILDTSEIDPNKLYKMWYGGTDSLKPDSTILGYAYSPNGINWTRVPAASSPFGEDGLVMIPGFTVGDAGVISDPTAVKIGGIYHVWYNSFGSLNDVLISHAISGDGFNWTKDISNPVLIPTVPWENFGPTGITADLVQPTVMVRPAFGDLLLCYGSFDSTIFERYDGFGLATSNDGTNWTKDISNPVFLPDTLKPGEEIGMHANSLVYVSGIYHMFYGGINSIGQRTILHATAPDDAVGIEITTNKSNIQIYPNPSYKYITIQTDYYENQIMNLYNMMGTKLMTEKIKNKRTIFIGDLNPGIYVLKIGNSLHKIIKN